MGIVIYVVKIDVKDWPDNVHGGERVMTRRSFMNLGTDLLWSGWLGGGPGTHLFQERFFGRSWFETVSS